jgi:hypothetical protein
MWIRRQSSRIGLTAIVLAMAHVALAQVQASQPLLDVTARIQLMHSASSKDHANAIPPAVLWLKPLTPGLLLPPSMPPSSGYTLLQKNKMFSPHLLVVPVGSVVMFPNADPFFHNVFSLFDGQRFDLGLYEAGKTKSVTFSREGISYIFCDIHPDMSAVVIALSTPLYGIADSNGAFVVHGVPPGDYEMHLWVEGEPQVVLERWVRRVHLSAANPNLGSVMLDASPGTMQHTNKFGQPYDRVTKPQY